MHEIDVNGHTMGAGEVEWVVRYNARKTDADRAADFFENHLDAHVDYCSPDNRCKMECTESGGCPHPIGK